MSSRGRLSVATQNQAQLLQILREIQEELDWISPETAHAVAAGLGIPDDAGR